MSSLAKHLSARPNAKSTSPTVVLTIAGFDPSSGAGVTADLQVFAAHGLFGVSCITALTVQSTLGVAFVESVSHLTAHTLEHLDADLPAVGIKIGMLADARGVRAVATFLRNRGPSECPVVLDPVLKSSSGKFLLDAEGLHALRSELLPLVTWVTPNLSELAVLSNRQITHERDVQPALEILHGHFPQMSIVATGGHLEWPTDTLLTSSGALIHLRGERVDTVATHGTGCAFSSALLARLVQGLSAEHATATAKAYVTEALRLAPVLGHGHGPMNLGWPCQTKA